MSLFWRATWRSGWFCPENAMNFGDLEISVLEKGATEESWKGRVVALSRYGRTNDSSGFVCEAKPVVELVMQVHIGFT